MVVDVFQDIACPWCRIGKKNLTDAIARWDGEPIQVRYRAYFLNDQIPSGGYEFKSYMHAKGGGQVALETFFDGPRRAGQAVGVPFNFERIQFAPNTLLAHRLIALASENKKTQMIDAAYAAYFEYGQDIGDMEVLLAIVDTCGLDVTDMRRRLLSDEKTDDVRTDDAYAREIGVTGVPFFLIESKWTISGAQPADVLLYADVTVQSVELTIPHPRMWERRFVMAPLADVAPDKVRADWETTLPVDGVQRVDGFEISGLDLLAGRK